MRRTEVRHLTRVAIPAGLLLYLCRAFATGGWSAAAFYGAADPGASYSLPVSTLHVLLPGILNGPAGFAVAALSVLGLGWTAARLSRLAGSGEGLLALSGVLPGLLLPTATPLGREAPLLLAAFALAGLAAAIATYLQRGGATVLLSVMLWSDLLALCSPDWIWAAIALCVGLLPLLAGGGRGRVEAPLAVLVAGGGWAFLLRLLVENGLGIVDRAPLAELGTWTQGLLGVSATIVLVVALTLLLTGRSSYGLTVALAVCGVVALIDVVVAGISAPAGLAVSAVCPALLGLALRGIARPTVGDVVEGAG